MNGPVKFAKLNRVVLAAVSLILRQLVGMGTDFLSQKLISPVSHMVIILLGRNDVKGH